MIVSLKIIYQTLKKSDLNWYHWVAMIPWAVIYYWMLRGVFPDAPWAVKEIPAGILCVMQWVALGFIVRDMVLLRRRRKELYAQLTKMREQLIRDYHHVEKFLP